MKQKINKNQLTFLGLVTITTLILWSCRSEEAPLNDEKNLQKINIERHVFSINHLEEHHKDAYEILSKLSGKLENPSTGQRHEDSYSEEYGLYLDLSKVYVIEHSDHTQFSLSVRKPELIENQFENYMLIKYPDGGYKQYILTYQYDIGLQGSFSNIGLRELQGSQLYTRSSSGCESLPELTPVVVSVCTFYPCTGEGVHVWGDLRCNCKDPLYQCTVPKKDCSDQIQWVMTCPEGGSGSGGCESDDCNGDDVGGGGGNDNGIPVVPIEIDYAQEIIDCINNNSSIGGTNYYVEMSEQTWLHGSSDENIIPVYDYLTGDSCSQEAQEMSLIVFDIMIGLEQLETIINKPDFDAFEDQWLDVLREYAEALSELRDRVSERIWRDLNNYLDQLLVGALNKTAFKLNPDADIDDDVEKDLMFQNDGQKGVGILLFEFANGDGPNVREFTQGDFYDQYFAGDRIQQIKDDFQGQLAVEQITFDEFVMNNQVIVGGNAFSPDHTSLTESFNQHVNANWVQFFVGGTRIEYKPSNMYGYIDVKIINPTSRSSLILHLAEDYDRLEVGPVRLSTIEQNFYITIKII